MAASLTRLAVCVSAHACVGVRVSGRRPALVGKLQIYGDQNDSCRLTCFSNNKSITSACIPT